MLQAQQKVGNIIFKGFSLYKRYTYYQPNMFLSFKYLVLTLLWIPKLNLLFSITMLKSITIFPIQSHFVRVKLYLDPFDPVRTTRSDLNWNTNVHLHTEICA